MSPQPSPTRAIIIVRTPAEIHRQKLRTLTCRISAAAAIIAASLAPSPIHLFFH